MNKQWLYFALVLFGVGCNKPEANKSNESQSDFSNALSAEELAGKRLTPEILWKFGRLGEMNISQDASDIVFSVTRYDAKTNKSNSDLFTVPSSGGEMKKITSTTFSESNPRWIKEKKRIAFLSPESGSSQIWTMNPDGTDRKQISTVDGDINSFEFSPTGDKIYFTKDVKMDQTPQEKYPDLPLTKVIIADDLMYRHWNAWTDYSYSHIFIAPVTEGKIGDPKDIMQGEGWDAPVAPYFDAAEICWSPDGKNIAYTSRKLRGKEYALSTNSDIYLYSLETGKTENLSEGMPGYDKVPAFSPDGKKIAWSSMATPGYESDKERLFVMDLTTREKKYLTESFDQDATNLCWSKEGNSIFFLSSKHGTVQIYRINTESLKIDAITEGNHDYTSLQSAGDKLLAARMSISSANEIFLVDPSSKSQIQVSNINKNIYDAIPFGKSEARWIKTTDNKDMHMWVIYPPDFDSLKKYPLLLFCEGGPQNMVSQFFSFRWNFQIMAANGYIIVAPNRRGVPGFGQAWEDQIAGDYGGQNIKDYLSAVDAMAKEPYVDKDRMGCVGASYGGYSVFYLAGHHQGRFKAFISHCGMFNFESEYGTTEEMWFPNHDLGGPYWQNPKPISYKYSPHLYVQNWNTPILIITGVNDMRVPFSESLQAFNAAQLRGIPSRLLLFPEESHFVLKPQNSILWQREFFQWLDTYLKPKK